jgi:hypothetical protein
VGKSGAKGYCFTHYQRLKNSGSLQPSLRASGLEVRLRGMRQGVCACGECAGCIRWKPSSIHAKTGYGQISSGNKTFLAHRVAYSLFVLDGAAIPDGQVIDHVYEKGCRHRDCTNEAHLEAVTAEVNTQRIPMTERTLARRSAAGRRAWSYKKGGTPRDRVLALVNSDDYPLNGYTVTYLAKHAGCSFEAVSRLLPELIEEGLIENAAGYFRKPT